MAARRPGMAGEQVAARKCRNCSVAPHPWGWAHQECPRSGGQTTGRRRPGPDARRRRSAARASTNHNQVSELRSTSAPSLTNSEFSAADTLGSPALSYGFAAINAAPSRSRFDRRIGPETRNQPYSFASDVYWGDARLDTGHRARHSALYVYVIHSVDVVDTQTRGGRAARRR